MIFNHHKNQENKGLLNYTSLVNPYFLMLLFFSLNALSLSAQKHIFKHFTVEDGLPSLSINQITQDKEGYIWFASDKGISRYDGYEFETFTVRDGLTVNDIRELFIDSKNRVWLIARDVPLTYFYEGVSYSFNNESLIALPHGIQEAPDGKIWLNTEEGLFYYNGDSLTSFDLENRSFIQIDSENRIWSFDGFNNAVYVQQNDKIKQLNIGLDSSEFIAGNIYPWLEDGIYFKTFNNFYFYKDSLVRLPYQSTRKLAEQFPPLVVSSRQVLEFSPTFTLKDQYEHLANFRFKNVFKDREGNLWFSTTGNGVYLLTVNSRNALTYDTEHGLEDQKITAVLQDQTDSLRYIGTFNGDFYIANEDKIIRQIALDNARYIRSLTQNKTHVFIANDEGLLILNKTYLKNPRFDYQNDFSLVSCRDSICIIDKTVSNLFLRIRGVKDMKVSSQDLLLATNNGVWNLDFSKEENYILQVLHREAANAIVSDNDQLWIGTDEGLFSFSNNQRKLIHGDLVFAKSKVVDLEIDNNGFLWAGTDGFGVFVLNKNRDAEKIIPETNRDLVQRIYKDKNGVIWASTNNGLHRLQLSDFEDFNYSIRTYKAYDGLATNEVNTLIKEGDKMVIGTNRGFTTFTPHQSKDSNYKPPIIINSILINERDTAVTNAYRLPYHQNNLTIGYVGISYKSDAELVYLYKMDGLDDVWQETNIRERKYQDLAPGTYTFHLKVRDTEGIESEEQIMEFVIRPPFWETFWFRFLAALAVVGTVITFTQWRITSFRKREEEKNRILQEKTQLQLKVVEEQAEINKINKELAQSKLETLQAQINPHFAYNALTSIQKFILTENKREANRYLVKFARLMRQFLEASKEKSISLSKELDLLRLYIEMEQLRFKNKFDYEIVVEPGIDTNAIQIPSMLLQIYVENAINHGLVYKEERGNLKLLVEREGNKIHCKVQDDGIGRKRAQEIKNRSVGAYKGLGMKITKERMKYMNLIEDKKVSVQINDDILGEDAGGTEVVLSMEI